MREASSQYADFRAMRWRGPRPEKELIEFVSA
jgi:hypothetical protein